MRRSPILISLAAASALLAACTAGPSDDETTEPPSSEPVTTDATTDPTTEPSTDSSTPADDPTGDLPEFPTGTEAQEGESSGEPDLVLVDVRVAEHEGFDRIVMEFTGTGEPGWTISYVDEPTLDGSGEVVALDGDSYLDIYATGTAMPQSEEDYYDGPKQFDPDAGDVEDVYVGGWFEGYTQVLAGIDGQAAPYRVFTLTEPSRLVIDVADVDD